MTHEQAKVGVRVTRKWVGSGGVPTDMVGTIIEILERDEGYERAVVRWEDGSTRDFYINSLEEIDDKRSP